MHVQHNYTYSADFLIHYQQYIADVQINRKISEFKNETCLHAAAISGNIIILYYLFMVIISHYPNGIHLPILAINCIHLPILAINCIHLSILAINSINLPI